MILISQQEDISTGDLSLGIVKGIHKGAVYYQTVPLSIHSLATGNPYSVYDYLKTPSETSTKFLSKYKEIADLTSSTWENIDEDTTNKHRIIACVPSLNQKSLLVRINDQSLDYAMDEETIRKAVQEQMDIYKKNIHKLPEALQSRLFRLMH